MNEQQLVRRIAQAVDECSLRDDPSPNELQKAMGHALAAIGASEEWLEAARPGGDFGDWAGGRVEPSDVAERVIYLGQRGGDRRA